ncbi:MAG: hypothetical protein Tsb0034_01670 [Ekhidna sp.]
MACVPSGPVSDGSFVKVLEVSEDVPGVLQAPQRINRIKSSVIFFMLKNLGFHSNHLGSFLFPVLALIVGKPMFSWLHHFDGMRTCGTTADDNTGKQYDEGKQDFLDHGMKLNNVSKGKKLER